LIQPEEVFLPLSPKALRLIDDLHHCALDPRSWYASMQALAEEVGAAGCLFYPDRAENAVGLRVSNELEDVLAAFLARGWHLKSHRFARGWPLLAAGQSVVLEHDIATDEERRRLPFYREWAEPSGLPWWAAIGLEANGEQWAVPFLRSKKQGAFTPDDALALAALRPHLERVLGFAQRIARRQTEAQLDMLDALDCGCFLIDWSGSVSRCNEAAALLLGQDLQFSRGRLVAGDAVSDAQLQSLIAQAVQPGAPTSKMRIALRRANAPPLVVEAMQVTSGIAELFLDSAALLMIEGARPRGILSNDLVGQAFALTPKEARLAALLGTGRELSDAAFEMGVAKETARTHLKAIFAKTDTNRQAELVSLLAALRR
jgi:DNA-binding CsgD family transcriptional regulator/PAS domain-containing protein